MGLRRDMKAAIVVKIGGSTLGSHDTTLEDLVTLQKRGGLPVVVHGGGKTISQWLDKHGIPTQFVNGLRVTDAQSLEVVVAVLAGLVNKELVAAINAFGGRAMGISGIDGGFIQARVKDPRLGLVGEVVNIDLTPLRVLLKEGYMPVIAPVAFQGNETSGKAGALLNLNADTVAGELAAALQAQKLIFLTDMPGVCDGDGRVLPRLSPAQVRELMASGVVSGGMVPKVEACLHALSMVPETLIKDGRLPHALMEGLEGEGGGTKLE